MNACILLGVWGNQHIQEFLELSLYSLLAPGNIPAFTSRFTTRFVFLTTASSISVFDNHPAYQKLKTYCSIEFITIDDLVMSGNYSTTLTLAYERAIKQTGEKMLETYFVFLTADYIMADGSLQGLMRYIDQGYSGICTGNYQVIEEEIKPYLVSKIDYQSLTMNISPRELVKKSLEHLHPITIASLDNQKIIHNYHANRFFLYHSPETMAGKFYLLHMLCIKPETTNYQIGASCDYSFIPEMCPSGNVAIINDSDDYLIIEIQPHKHELSHIKWGLANRNKLIDVLAEWTTVQQRKNVETTIYYHANDLDRDLKHELDTRLKNFIDGISANLSSRSPKPHRNHPYWLGAIKALKHFKSIETKSSPYAFLDSPNFDGVKSKYLYPLLGRPPKVFPWHFQWRSYAAMRKMIRQALSTRSTDSVVCLYDDYDPFFLEYARWLKKLNVTRQFVKTILLSEPDITQFETQKADLIFCFISMKQIKELPTYLPKIKRILSPVGRVMLVIANKNNHFPNALYDFQVELAHNMNIVNNCVFEVESTYSVLDDFTLYGAFIIKLIKHQVKNKYIRTLCYALIGVPGSIICLIRNALSLFFKKKTGHCTDIIITLTR